MLPRFLVQRPLTQIKIQILSLWSNRSVRAGVVSEATGSQCWAPGGHGAAARLQSQHDGVHLSHRNHTGMVRYLVV